MSSAFRLSEVHDVGNVAIITLHEKGYRVWWEASERPSADDWWAEKEGRKFVERSPLSLLGLVSLWESRGDKWQKTPSRARSAWATKARSVGRLHASQRVKAEFTYSINRAAVTDGSQV